MVIQYIRSGANEPADTLSRANLGDAFQLNPAIFRALATSVGGLDVDRFATPTNTLLPTYNTYFFEQGTSGVDAFA